MNRATLEEKIEKKKQKISVLHMQTFSGLENISNAVLEN
jgi:hypothetical protein